MSEYERQHGGVDDRPRYVPRPEQPETYTGETDRPDVHFCKITCTEHLD